VPPVVGSGEEKDVFVYRFSFKAFRSEEKRNESDVGVNIRTFIL
jgi:hypothetical protein